MLYSTFIKAGLEEVYHHQQGDIFQNFPVLTHAWKEIGYLCHWFKHKKSFRLSLMVAIKEGSAEIA